MRHDDEKWLEELSARMDGEEQDALRVEHPEARDRAAQYAALGEMLRAMPDPQEDPWFSTRVMARVREDEQRGRHRLHSWRYWFAGGMLAATAALATIIMYPGHVEAPGDANVAAISAPEFDEDLDAMLMALAEESEELAEGEAEEGETEAELLTDEWHEEVSREVYAYVSAGDTPVDEGELL